MLRALTRSRTASFHRRSMVKVIAAAAAIWFLWEPARPIRQVTANVMYFTADQIAR